MGCSHKVSREGDLWAMALTCVKILKENGQVQYTSSYSAVSNDEMMNDNKKKERELFDKSIEEKLGKPTTLEDLQSSRMVPLPNMDSVRLTSRGRMCIS